MALSDDLKGTILWHQKEINSMRKLEETVSVDPSWKPLKSDMLKAINEYRATLLEHFLKDMAELKRRTEIIKTAPDAMISEALRLKYTEGRSWEDIARKLNTTAAALKKACYRYIKKQRSNATKNEN